MPMVQEMDGRNERATCLPTEERSARISCLGAEEEVIHPGDTLRIGRHASNDLVLADPRVSRFHARITWPPHAGRPRVQDLLSQNGLFVDGRRVRSAVLQSGARLTLGACVLRVELTGDEAPALLEGGDDLVVLFSDLGGATQGPLPSTADLRALLLRLELDRRTGTLALARVLRDEVANPGLGADPGAPTERARILLCLGRIIDARAGDSLGLAAFTRILSQPWDRYRFTPQVEVEDGTPLRVFPSDLLRRLEKGTHTWRVGTREQSA